jgi:hypothetical protein
LSTDQDRVEHLCEHIGIEPWPRLKLLCEQFAVEFKCDVFVYGSAMRTKDWRDVDLALVFEYNRYCQISNPSWGPNAYSVLCSALTMYASAVVGLPVEVHCYSQALQQTPYLQLGKKPA